MKSSRVVRAFDCQCKSRNSPGLDPSILQHSGRWGAADETVLNSIPVYHCFLKKVFIIFFIFFATFFHKAFHAHSGLKFSTFVSFFLGVSVISRSRFGSKTVTSSWALTTESIIFVDPVRLTLCLCREEVEPNNNKRDQTQGMGPLIFVCKIVEAFPGAQPFTHPDPHWLASGSERIFWGLFRICTNFISTTATFQKSFGIVCTCK
jgi:hypothetical protein